ncbi:MAG: hypothetical protein WCJ93_09655 [Methanomicrobiales archaeon]
MAKYLVLLIAVALVAVTFAGCTGASADDNFKNAWSSSEKEVILYGTDIRPYLEPDHINVKAMSDRSKQMITTIDKNYQTISDLQVSSKYTVAKQDYLAGLSDLRMACVDLSQASDAGGLKAVGLVASSAPWLKSSQEKRDKVKAVMNG